MAGQWRVRAAAALCPLLLAGCCGGTGATARHLDARMQYRLAPQVTARQASVQRLPDGTQIALDEQTLFPPGNAVLSDHGRFVLASVIEGLMAPTLMRVEVTPSTGTPPWLQRERLQAVQQFLTDYALGPLLAPATTAPATQAMTITVRVSRPHPG